MASGKKVKTSSYQEREGATDIREERPEAYFHSTVSVYFGIRETILIISWVLFLKDNLFWQL